MIAARLGPEAFSGRALDQALRAGQASIDQHPAPVASLAGAEEDHVDDAEAPIGEIRQHLVRLVVPRRIQRRLKSAGVGGQRNLLCHGRARDEIPRG
jgi:hypothetical protein